MGVETTGRRGVDGEKSGKEIVMLLERIVDVDVLLLEMEEEWWSENFIC